MARSAPGCRFTFLYRVISLVISDTVVGEHQRRTRRTRGGTHVRLAPRADHGARSRDVTQSTPEMRRARLLFGSSSSANLRYWLLVIRKGTSTSSARAPPLPLRALGSLPSSLARPLTWLGLGLGVGVGLGLGLTLTLTQG